MSYGLTLVGVTLPGGQDPLGLCHVAPAAVAFEASAESAPEVPSWHESLPASPEDAESLLAAQRAALRQRQTTLASIQHDLASLAEPEIGTSFSTSATIYHPQQLEKLQADLQTFQPSAESFGLFDHAPAFDAQLAQEWHEFVGQAERIIAHYARIETSMAGLNVGRTIVTWTGDFRTTWQNDVPDPARRIHLKSVQVALASRMLLIHTAAIVIGGAAGLALKAASLPPGGQVLLLPSVWRFVKDVLAELNAAT